MVNWEAMKMPTPTLKITKTPIVPEVRPLDYSDNDRICHISKNGLMAECARCGFGIIGQVHMPMIAHGFFHAGCCPCRSFVPTPTEQHTLKKRQAGHVTGALVASVPPEEKLSRSEMMKLRWQDPAARRRMMVRMKGRKWRADYSPATPAVRC
jgi:hypothetical protein